MEREQRNFIDKHLVELVENISCNTGFLATFLARGIFTHEDVEQIEAVFCKHTLKSFSKFKLN